MISLIRASAKRLALIKALRRLITTGRTPRYLEIMPVTLSAAKGLVRRMQRSFASLRMTARTPLKSYLQMSEGLQDV